MCISSRTLTRPLRNSFKVCGQGQCRRTLTTGTSLALDLQKMLSARGKLTLHVTEPPLQGLGVAIAFA